MRGNGDDAGSDAGSDASGTWRKERRRGGRWRADDGHAAAAQTTLRRGRESRGSRICADRRMGAQMRPEILHTRMDSMQRMQRTASVSAHTETARHFPVQARLPDAVEEDGPHELDGLDELAR